MKDSYTLETIKRVYDDSNGVYIEISLDPDTGTAISIRTTDKGSKEYFGEIDLTLQRGMAKLLGEALITMSQDLPVTLSCGDVK